MSDLRTSDQGRDRGSAAGATFRRISWGAILAGAVLALMIQFMLGLLGLGIGLTGAEALTAGSSAGTSLLSVAGIWSLLVVLIGVFAGAYAAARFAGIPDKIDGMLHGVVTWAVAGLFALYLLVSGASNMVGSAFGVLGQSFDNLASAAEILRPRSEGELPQALRADVEMLFAAPAATPVAAETGDTEDGEAANDAPASAPPPAPTGNRSAALARVEAALGEGADESAREAAVESIAAAAGVPRAEAERRFARFEERYQAAMTNRRQAAEAAASTLSSAAFGAFVAMLLGFAVAAGGGLFGRPATAPLATSSSRRSV